MTVRWEGSQAVGEATATESVMMAVSSSLNPGCAGRRLVTSSHLMAELLLVSPLSPLPSPLSSLPFPLFSQSIMDARCCRAR